MVIDGENLTLADVIKVAIQKEMVEISLKSKEKIEKSRQYVEKIIENDDVVYFPKKAYNIVREAWLNYNRIT